MSRHAGFCLGAFLTGTLLLSTIIPVGSARAGDHDRHARRRVVVTRARPVYPQGAAQPGPLGTFMPTPMVWIGGDFPNGGGYSPLGIYGDQTMSLYGPTSFFRTATAPVVVYTRGYDGVVRPTEGYSTSYPNRPCLSPVAYPTHANNYYGPRILEDPRKFPAFNWLDQN
jgi:hypothetical protein